MKQRPVGASLTVVESQEIGDVNQARFPGMHLKMDTPCSSEILRAFPGMSETIEPVINGY